MTRSRAALAVAAAAALGLAGCSRPRPQPGPAAVHYVVGGGYRMGGTWFYPREDFTADVTGLATVLPDRTGHTADGEVAEGGTMSGAMQTLQLPAVVRVTNLENGSSALLRINDRGPASPGRVIGLSRRSAALLGVDGVARVRVQVQEAPSLALRDQLNGGTRLAVAAAPRGAVTAEALAPPAGVGQSARGRAAAGATVATAAVEPERGTVPERLPEEVSRGAAAPGRLMIRAGNFGQMQYARQVVAKLAGTDARVDRVREGRTERYQVVAGPFSSVAAADSALDRALSAGVSDARIVVE